MIYTNATGLVFPSFTGGADDPATPDVIRHCRAAEPLVLENQVNAIGQAESALGRYLMGIQIGGAGKGHQFAVNLLFDAEGTTTGMKFALDPDGNGIRAFCFKGETAEALSRNKDLAMLRVQQFVSGTWIKLEYRGFEVSGANDGMVYMGILLIHRELII
jgi:hypothetical protein